MTETGDRVWVEHKVIDVIGGVVSILDYGGDFFNLHEGEFLTEEQVYSIPREDEYKLTAAAASAIALQFLECFQNKPHASVPEYIEWMEDRLQKHTKKNK